MPEKEMHELAELHAQLSALAAAIDRAGKELIPYYVAKDELRTALMQTHETRYHHERLIVVRWVREGSLRRAPLFERLDRLNHQWAPQVNTKRLLTAQQRGLRAEVKRLSDIVAKQQAKAR